MLRCRGCEFVTGGQSQSINMLGILSHTAHNTISPSAHKSYGDEVYSHTWRGRGRGRRGRGSGQSDIVAVFTLSAATRAAAAPTRTPTTPRPRALRRASPRPATAPSSPLCRFPFVPPLLALPRCSACIASRRRSSSSSRIIACSVSRGGLYKVPTRRPADQGPQPLGRGHKLRRVQPKPGRHAHRAGQGQLQGQFDLPASE